MWGAFVLLFFFLCRRGGEGLVGFADAQIQPQAAGGQQKYNGQHLRGAQVGAPDVQTVGAQTFDPAAAQAVPHQIQQKDLAVELAAVQVQGQQQHAQQIPQGFIQKGGMHRRGAVDAHAPGQGGLIAKGLGVAEVAPAADALSDEEAGGS